MNEYKLRIKTNTNKSTYITSSLTSHYVTNYFYDAINDVDIRKVKKSHKIVPDFLFGFLFRYVLIGTKSNIRN